MTKKNFTDKTVFITGAGSGIGYQVALAFAEKGANIIASDINQRGLDELSAEIQKHDIAFKTVILNVADEASYRALAEQLDKEDNVPDIVINNAGLGFTGSFTESSMDDWRLVLDVNVMGVVFGCRFFSDIWQTRKMPGHLVNISSMAAYMPVPNMAAYVASKYAVEGFSDALNLEYTNNGISVTCVHPGIINTPIVHNNDRFSIPKEQIERLQKYYVENGATPRSVAEDIVKGVENKTKTVLTGKGVGLINMLKRILPKNMFLKTVVSEARKAGFLPLK